MYWTNLLTLCRLNRKMELSVLCVPVILISILYTSPVTSVTIGSVGNATEVFSGGTGKAIFMTEVIVPEGNFTVTRFTMILKTLSKPFQEFKIQIYRPVVDLKYELIFEHDVPSKSTYDGLFELNIAPTSVTTGDRIALYNDGPYVPVPYTTGGLSLPYIFGKMPPAIGDVLDFGRLSYPIGFTLEMRTAGDGNDSVSSNSTPFADQTTQATIETTSSLPDISTTDSSACPEQTTPSVKLCDAGSMGCSHHCVDVPGGFRCACTDGYTLDASDNVTCNDENECNANNGFCQHKCTNKVGSYICSCSPGYFLTKDSHSCLDTDECANSSMCASQELCVNTPGTFVCLKDIRSPCDGEVGFSTQDKDSLISVPTFIGFFVWLSLLTLIIVILISVAGSRGGHSSDNNPRFHSETAFCYEGPYNPKEEEILDRERIASQIRKKYPTVSINPPI